MIFNYIYTFPNSTNGTDSTIIQLIQQVPLLMPFTLAFIWFVVFLSGINMQRARIGTADYAGWATTASLAMFITTLIFSLVAGFIRLEWLVIVIVITIFSGVWLFLDRKPSEV